MDAGKLHYLGQESLRILSTKLPDLRPDMRVVMRTKITQFHLDEKGFSLNTEYESLEKLDWSIATYGLIEKEIKSMPIFKEIVNLIAEEHEKVFPEGVNRTSQAEFWLSNFVSKVLHEKLEGEFTEESLVDYVSTFCAELDASPVQHHLVGFLSGVYVKADTVKLQDRIVLRKPDPADLEYEFEPFIPHFHPQMRFGLPSAVLEIQMRISKDTEIFEKFNELTILLRLFRLGSVQQLWHKHIKKTIMWPEGTGFSWPGGLHGGTHKYVVNELDISALKQFINSFAPLIKMASKDKTMMGWNVALNRYNSALLENIETERKLMTAVMGLESLYSIPNDRGEIGFRLSLRTAKLLGLLMIDSMRIKKEIEKAYQIRNKVTHGLILNEEEIKNAQSLLTRILDYLRVSLIFFIKAGFKNKNELLVLIDNSLISQSHSEELHKKVNETLINIPKEIFVTNPV